MSCDHCSHVFLKNAPEGQNTDGMSHVDACDEPHGPAEGSRGLQTEFTSSAALTSIVKCFIPGLKTKKSINSGFLKSFTLQPRVRNYLCLMCYSILRLYDAP